jgi:hypothetical protein
MARTTGPGLPAGVKALAARIERWRRTRERRTAMPADLWSEAVSLARVGRAYAVARALRLNFDGLKRRMAETQAGAPAPTGAFVELAGAQVLGTGPGAVVEFTGDDGVRMTVRLASGSGLDVARVVAAFRTPRA